MSDLLDGPRLLTAAAAYCLTSLPAHIGEEAAVRQTPCDGWDVRMLLDHTLDSVLALNQLALAGVLTLVASCSDDLTDDADQFLLLREQAGALGASWDAMPAWDGLCVLDDQLIWASTAASAGAIEVAVHTWDLAQAFGLDRPVPSSLARDLLDIATRLVGHPFRQPEFAERVPVPVTATDSEQLLGFLGRDPQRRKSSNAPGAAVRRLP